MSSGFTKQPIESFFSKNSTISSCDESYAFTGESAVKLLFFSTTYVLYAAFGPNSQTQYGFVSITGMRDESGFN